ncbi:hypothetical protein GCM10010232_66430 [Streptomyces amakusaensis]|uniref:Uncharacterized protein n=1 Tax=Streptomyces amakusaensis TaxID=67271 RepID=A0ABW0ARI4_9ACTN
MTLQPAPGPVVLDAQQAQSLVTLLREVEQFLDECDETVEEALAAHFGLHPASEAFSAALCFHADTLEAALAGQPTRDTLTSRTPTPRISPGHHRSGHSETR